MAITGRCYCGAVRFEAEGDPLFRVQCHCRECQYISGGQPNMVMGMTASGFRLTKGELKTFRRSDLDNPVTREFCAECGTHVVTRSSASPAVYIKVGTLDDPGIFGQAQAAIWTSDKQSFHHVPEGVPTFERAPG